MRNIFKRQNKEQEEIYLFEAWESIQEFLRKEEQKYERIEAIKRTLAYFGLGLGVGMMVRAFVGAVSETINEGLQ